MTDQLRIFLICVLIGVVGGALYDVFFFIRNCYRKQWFRVLCDILFCCAFATVYVLFSVTFGFPPLRFYFILGLTLGLFLYLKSFHKIVAFFSEKLYNGLNRRYKGKTRHGRRGKGAKAS